MKRLLLSAFSVFVFSSVFAQLAEQNLAAVSLPIGYNTVDLQMKDRSKYLNLDRKGRALSFVYSQFDAADKLNAYLDAAASTRSGSFQPYYMAIGWEKITTTSEHIFDGIGSVSFLIPYKVEAGPADSLQMRLGGWHATVSVLGVDLIPGETVALVLAPAWSYGNLKMRRTEAGQKTWYTNPFVAPGGRGEFRLVLGKFMLGGRVTYRYDITHALWKRKDNMMPVLPEYKNSGLAYFGYIGLIF